MTARLSSEQDDSLPAYARHKEDEEEAPSYPLELLSLGRPPLDPSAVEASAPRPRPTRWARFWSIWPRAKLIVPLVFFTSVALIAGMAWFGVHRRHERRANPAQLSAALQMVYPSLLSQDGSLLAPFNFSSPSVSNASFIFSSSNTVNSTILTSSAHLILPSANSSAYFVKIFGNRSTDVTFSSSSSKNETEWTATVEALWKVTPGANQSERMQWGMDQLSRTTGGSYGEVRGGTEANATTGLALFTFGNETTSSGTLWTDLPFPDRWADTSMLFNVTILMPPGFNASRLEVFSTAAGEISFGELRNVTFDSIDVRIPFGTVQSYFNQAIFTRLLNIFGGNGIFAWFSLNVGTLLSHGTIQAQFDFPTFSSSVSSAPNLTLITTAGIIYANVTSVPDALADASSPGINVDATALATYQSSSDIKVYLPLWGFNGTFEMATNEGSARAAFAPEGWKYNALGWVSYGGKGDPSTDVQKLEGIFEPKGNGTIRLNTKEGEVRLSVGPGNFATF